MADLIMLRHGQSTYNQENRFTGWLDVPLTEHGIQEAESAAVKLFEYKIDIAYTSKLKRAIDTLNIILDMKKNDHIPIIENVALNERNYGELQGLNKADVTEKYGETQVLLWRRSFNITPPGGESLKDTSARVLPFFRSVICKDISKGLNVLVVAHGNSLRAIFKELDGISDEDIVSLNINTGKIYLYQLDPDLIIVNKKIL
ncbi:MAG: 2,3-bisphosphoglycerate-dependent phosphoglycerate mutase [Chitinophagales bacterium]